MRFAPCPLAIGPFLGLHLVRHQIQGRKPSHFGLQPNRQAQDAKLEIFRRLKCGSLLMHILVGPAVKHVQDRCAAATVAFVGPKYLCTNRLTDLKAATESAH